MVPGGIRMGMGSISPFFLKKKSLIWSSSCWILGRITAKVSAHYFSCTSGTPALTSRGFMEGDFEKVAEYFDGAVKLALKIKAEAKGYFRSFTRSLVFIHWEFGSTLLCCFHEAYGLQNRSLHHWLRHKVEGFCSCYAVRWEYPIGNCKASTWGRGICEAVSNGRLWERDDEVQGLMKCFLVGWFSPDAQLTGNMKQM